VRQADIDDGGFDGQTSAEQNELVQLRREKRRLEMENEIPRRRQLGRPQSPTSASRWSVT
jgi:transposase